MKNREKNEISLSEVANSDLRKTSKGEIRAKRAPKDKPLDLKRSLSSHSSEILDDVYESLGGVQGSRLYWMNHEEQFRTMVESKFLTKQVLKETAVAQAQEVGKNIFMTFIQNNGLSQKENLPQVEATFVNPELEEKE